MTDVEDAELGRLAAAAIERRGHLRGNLIDVTAPGGIASSPLCVIGSFYYAATGSFDGWGDPAAEQAQGAETIRDVRVEKDPPLLGVECPSGQHRGKALRPLGAGHGELRLRIRDCHRGGCGGIVQRG